MNYLFYIENGELCYRELHNWILPITLKGNENAVFTKESKLCYINANLNRDYKNQFKSTNNPSEADYIVIGTKFPRKNIIKKNYQYYNIINKECDFDTHWDIASHYEIPQFTGNKFYFSKECMHQECVTGRCAKALNNWVDNIILEGYHFEYVICFDKPVDKNKFIFEEQVIDANENVITDDKYDKIRSMLNNEETRKIALKMIDTSNFKKSAFNILKLIYEFRYIFHKCSTSLITNLIKATGLTQAILGNINPLQCMIILGDNKSLTKSAFNYFKDKATNSYACKNGNLITMTWEASWYDPEPEPIIKEEVKPKINRDLFGEPMTITAKQTTKIKSKELNW